MPPPPFLGMKTTPATSSAARILSTASFAMRLDTPVSNSSIVGTGTPAVSASFACDQPIRARAALTCAASTMASRSFRRCRGYRDGRGGGGIANVIAERLARERRFAAAGRVIERQLLKFVRLGRLDGEIAVGPAVGRLKRSLEDFPRLQEEAAVFPGLAEDLESVARIENEARFDGQASAAVAAELQAESAAFEGVDALVVDHQLEPEHGAQDLFRATVLDRRCPLEDGANMVKRVKRAPRGSVGVLPFLVAHFRMMRDAVVEVVFVDVGVHPDPLGEHLLVILRPRQWREEEELENIKRQFALDDLDVAQDRLFRVGWEAEDVAGESDGAVRAPFLQHHPIFGDLVLPLLGGDEILGVDVLKPDEHAFDAGGRRLLDEVLDLVAERVDLDGEADVDAFLLQLDHSVEQNFPVAVAGEIVVGDEEPVDALRVIGADDLFEIVGRAKAALAPLDVDDGAERALIGTAATEIDAGIRPGGALDMLARQDRRWLANERLQLVHIIVKRLEVAVPRVEQHFIEPVLLGFAGEHRDAERLRLDDLRRKLGQHGETARDMEAAQTDLIASGAKLTRDIRSAGKLVRLHPYDAYQRPPAPALEVADDPVREHAAIGLVVGVDLDPHTGAQNLALAGVLGQAVHAGECVGRQRRAEPLDRIAVIVIVRRLDEDESK